MASSGFSTTGLFLSDPLIAKAVSSFKD